jgi:hypothetical protein
MPDIVRHKRASKGNGVGSDQNVKLTDGSSAFGKDAANPSELGSGRFVEWDHFNCCREGIDQTVEFARPLAIGAIAKLGQSNRADAEIRGQLSLQARADLALPAEREADAIRVEEVPHLWLNGSFREPTARAGGLGMSSVQAPRHLRNSAGHSLAGSRMTCFPRLLTITSSKSSLNRHDFGSRTAWLPPFWKIFARSAMLEVYT